jgi:hypothetical protein
MYHLIECAVGISKWEIQSTLSDSKGIRWGIPGYHGSGWNISILWDVKPRDSIFRVQEQAASLLYCFIFQIWRN